LIYDRASSPLPPAFEIMDLKPQRSMDPYKPCWCGSGKKWKWCHKVREAMRAPAYGELHAKMLDEAKNGICMHPAAPAMCSRKIVKAHTVQKSGGLSAIAENGHVISTLAGYHALAHNGGELVPMPVGINSASTFLGFCSAHDSDFFRPAEYNLQGLTNEVAFLLAYRAMAYEYYAKLLAERWHPVQTMADYGQPFETQVAIQQQFHWLLQGTRLAINDFVGVKERLDAAWLEQRFDEISYFAIEFENCMPIVGCGGFAPEFDFLGRTQQHLGRSEIEHIYFNWTVIDGRSVAIFAWLQSEHPYCRDFVESFKQLPPSEFANALIRMVFEHIENIYFRPSWWSTLKPESTEKLVLKMRNGTINGERNASGLLSDGLAIFQNVSVSNTYGN
jgi:hypothetical protein